MPPKSTPPKNTATREYFAPNPTTDSASNEDIDWPADDDEGKVTNSSPQTPSSSSKDPALSKSPGPSSGSGKGKGKEKSTTSPQGDEEDDERGEGKKDETPSPTPSDVVLNADVRDVGTLAAENKKLMAEGVGEGERRRRLEGMRG